MTKFIDKDFVIYILWIVFGFLYFDRHSAQFDELLMLDILRTTEIESLFYVLTSVETQLPLSYLWSLAFSEMFSGQLWGMRIPSLIFTLMTPVPMYYWAKNKLGREQAKCVSLMWMFSYPTVYYFYSIRPYSALVFFFICFMYYLESDSVNHRKKSFLLVFFGLLMALTHPVGLLLVTLSLVWSLFSSPHGRGKLTLLAAFLSIIIAASTFIITRAEDFGSLIEYQMLWPSLTQVYNSMGFIFSGFPFAFFVLIMGFYSIVRRQKYPLKRRDYSLFVFITTFFTLVFFQMFTSLMIGPRHYIVLLPLLLLSVSGVLFKLSENKSLVRTFVYIGVLCLIVKSFLLERLIQKPPNINSSDLATQVFNFSAFNEKVVSCGNCPSYYIPDERLVCLSSMDEFDFEGAKDYFVLIEYSHEKGQCDSEVLGTDYVVTRQSRVEGAMIKYYEKR